MEKLSNLKFGNLPQLTEEEMKLVAGGGGASISNYYICYIQEGSSSRCYKGSNPPSGAICNCQEAYARCGSI